MRWCVHAQDDWYALEVPAGGRDHEAITLGEAYRVAVLRPVDHRRAVPRPGNPKINCATPANRATPNWW